MGAFRDCVKPRIRVVPFMFNLALVDIASRQKGDFR
jgi:hypothetical protein